MIINLFPSHKKTVLIFIHLPATRKKKIIIPIPIMIKAGTKNDQALKWKIILNYINLHVHVHYHF